MLVTSLANATHLTVIDKNNSACVWNRAKLQWMRSWSITSTLLLRTRLERR
jgi:hypothetical protein